MSFFTRIIQTAEGRNATFYFNRIYTVEGTRYYISVQDEDKNRVSLNMAERNKEWHFVMPSKIPNWLIQLQPEISRIIVEYLDE